MIAFDAKSTDGNSFSTTLTISHTCSGVDRLLVVVAIYRGNGGDTITATYNGVSMTEAVRVVEPDTSNLITQIFYLPAPDTGTHDVVITCSENDNLRGYVASFTGVKQSSPLDVTGSTNAATGAPSTAVTPTVAGALVVDGYVHESASAQVVGAGQTELYSTDEGVWCTGASYVIQTTPALETMDWTGGSDNWSQAVVSFQPKSQSGWLAFFD